jgi:hypothetical protein
VVLQAAVNKINHLTKRLEKSLAVTVGDSTPDGGK